MICISHCNKIYFLKEKRKKKKAFTSGGGAGLQRSNAINDGLVRWVCVYGGISLQTKSKGLCQPTNLLYFFCIFVTTSRTGEPPA
ncbi:hypothetical protein CAP36_02765 [Chitinophagaceae bacterium IBVUCB2]|nr:hypothetical protein CAP36_02765 [Chitinophagaceae bacterium IBVUCB2]